MKKAESAVPKGYHTITPSLVIDGAAAAIDWYAKVLGAKEMSRMLWQGGKIAHAALLLGDSIVFLADPFPGAKDPKALGGSPSSMVVYTEDCDAVFNKAVAEGAKQTMPVEDQFWGDRAGSFVDPFGHHWMVMTHKEELTEEEMKKRGEEWFKKMAKK
jgi:PhnB protein